MKREIKFRGRSVHSDDWCYGSFVNNPDEPYICGFDIWTNGTNDWFEEKVELRTVGQFTGLHDKNGKEIYEGDIIQLNYPQWNNIVFWNNDMLCFEYRRICQKQSYSLAMNEMQLRYFEVIGNIYDNPELLKGDDK